MHLKMDELNANYNHLNCQISQFNSSAAFLIDNNLLTDKQIDWVNTPSKLDYFILAFDSHMQKICIWPTTFSEMIKYAYDGLHCELTEAQTDDLINQISNGIDELITAVNHRLIFLNTPIVKKVIASINSTALSLVNSSVIDGQFSFTYKDTINYGLLDEAQSITDLIEFVGNFELRNHDAMTLEDHHMALKSAALGHGSSCDYYTITALNSGFKLTFSPALAEEISLQYSIFMADRQAIDEQVNILGAKVSAYLEQLSSGAMTTEDYQRQQVMARRESKRIQKQKD